VAPLSGAPTKAQESKPARPSRFAPPPRAGKENEVKRNASVGRELAARSGGGWVLCHDICVVNVNGEKKTYGTAPDGRKLELVRRAKQVVARRAMTERDSSVSSTRRMI
jgi:hypothetical protein